MKNIWLIGATSGIGLKLAQQAAKTYDNVIVSGRSNFAPNQENQHFVRCDISDQNSLNQAIVEIEEKFKEIHTIVFAAGIYEPMSLENFNLEKSQEILRINFSGFLFLVDRLKYLETKMKLQQIAVVSSIAGYFGMPNSMVYGASKAALSNLTESLFYELKGRVKVQLINPGFVKTRLTDKNNFKMPFIISDEKAAEIILKKINSKNFEISFPQPFSGIMRFLKVLPYCLRTKLLSKVRN